MKRNHFVETVGPFMLVLAMIACALPGHTAQPTPVIPYPVQTSLAGTAEVTAKQTKQAGLVTSTPIVAITEHPSSEVISPMSAI